MGNSKPTTPAAELNVRLAEFQAHLCRKAVDGALIVQKTDLFYFAGTVQQAHLYIPSQGQPLLMVRKDFKRACAESAIERILPLDGIGRLPELLRLNGCRPEACLGMELDVLPVNLFRNYQSLFPGLKIVDISHAIRLVRAVKSTYEIALVKRACQCADQVAGMVGDLIFEGLPEIELAGMVEAAARRLGHQGLVRMRLWGAELFYGHLMSGPPAAAPSYLASPTGGRGINAAVAQGASRRPIKKREPILVDYVFALDGYLSDHTRIFALDGVSDELQAAHQAMRDIQAAVKAEARPGVPAAALYALATALAVRKGVDAYFMGADALRIKFVGHGIGLELDEYPFLGHGQELRLQAGMVVALEPKAVIPGKGVVGIENTHLVTAAGLEQLTLFDEAIQIIPAGRPRF